MPHSGSLVASWPRRPTRSHQVGLCGMTTMARMCITRARVTASEHSVLNRMCTMRARVTASAAIPSEPRLNPRAKTGRQQQRDNYRPTDIRAAARVRHNLAPRTQRHTKGNIRGKIKQISSASSIAGGAEGLCIILVGASATPT